MFLVTIDETYAECSFDRSISLLYSGIRFKDRLTIICTTSKGFSVAKNRVAIVLANKNRIGEVMRRNVDIYLNYQLQFKLNIQL